MQHPCYPPVPTQPLAPQQQHQYPAISTNSLHSYPSSIQQQPQQPQQQQQHQLLSSYSSHDSEGWLSAEHSLPQAAYPHPGLTPTPLQAAAAAQLYQQQQQQQQSQQPPYPYPQQQAMQQQHHYQQQYSSVSEHSNNSSGAYPSLIPISTAASAPAAPLAPSPWAAEAAAAAAASRYPSMPEPYGQLQQQHQQGSLYPMLQQQTSQLAPHQASPYPRLSLSDQPSQALTQTQQQQQQQQQGPLPPYPKIPPALTYNAPVEKVQYGYDVLVYITQASNLPGMDWWNGKADPYVIVTILAAGAEQQLEYKTKTIQKSLDPKFDEFFELGNLPAGSSLVVEVWDKDMMTDDDIIGRACWQFAPKELLGSTTAGGGMLGGDDSWGRLPVALKLSHPVKKKQFNNNRGTIEIEVCYRPSRQPGSPALLGPVKFRQHLSPAAGALTGHWGNADTMSFSTYKLYLMHIDSVFKEVKMPWNKNYDKAKTVFTNPMVMGMVVTQHNSLYSTRIGTTRCGVLTSPQDFFELFKFGQRAGQRRYFTYTLLEDSLRCSETGAAFFSDMMSKHAMHACGAEEVLYAGEFCIVPDTTAAGGYRLVIDNNSGTYAPDAKRLVLMQKLFQANFKDMTVDVLQVGDPRLEYYQQQCPSRAGI